MIHVYVAVGWSSFDKLQVYLLRTYQVVSSDDDFLKHFRYMIDEIMKKRIPHRPIYTALTVPRLGRKEMVIEVEVEAYRSPQAKA